jgi:hypothetical protein
MKYATGIDYVELSLVEIRTSLKMNFPGIANPEKNQWLTCMKYLGLEP